MSPRWQDHEIASLKTYALSGKTMEEAAFLLGRSRHSVNSKRKSAKVSFGGRGSKALQTWARKLHYPGLLDPAFPQPVVPECAHVAQLRREGGFPRAEMIAGQTTWIWPVRMERAA